MKKLLLLAVCVFTASMAFCQTTLTGTVKDKESGEPLINASVLITKSGVLVRGIVTDFDGNFSENLEPGTYDVEIKYSGYQSQKMKGILVKAGKANPVTFEMANESQNLEEIVIKEYKVPIIDKDNTAQGATITSEQIRNLPTKNVNGIVAVSAGASSIDAGDVSIRGGRTDQTVYYLDGIRYTGRSIPASEIEQLQVITGGIEAQYGDVAGGIVSQTSKGPSSKHSGGLELETSQFLDAYGYNLISGNVSGPIWKKRDSVTKVERTIIGYRFSVQLNDFKDDDPPAYGVYRAKESTIQRLSKDPISLFRGTQFVTGQFLDPEKDVEFIKFNPGEENKTRDFIGKLDFKPTSNIDFSVTGVYATVNDRFTPGVNGESDGVGETVGNGSWTLLNWNHNPYRKTDTYRGLFRFRHKLGRTRAVDASEDASTANLSPISNFYYTLQGGYENILETTQDPIHKNNFFNYGFVGKFDRSWEPAYDQQSGDHVGYVPLVRGYTDGTINPVFTAYNKILPVGNAAFNIEAYNAFNGQLLTSNTTLWTGLHTNVGSIYNRFTKSDDEIITAQLTSGFDLTPRGNSNSRHNIQFGFLFEQRIDRGYTLTPFELWRTGRLLANNHITGIDTTCVAYYDTLGRPVFCGLISPNPEARFYKELRRVINPSGDQEKLAKEYVNIDQLDPSQLSLGMFSSRELTDQSLVGFRGYDYQGNKLSRGVKFEDFFKRDANGNYSYLVAPNTPIYAAGYVQDKFTYKDIIFRVGVRADYYDANTKVIKDQYSLYDILGAKTFHEKFGGNKPGNIGDDYKVYTNSEGGSSVKAYRYGNNWYFPNGTLANSSSSIFGENNLVFPSYLQPSDSLRSIRGNYFIVDNSFEDYKPQVNIMPRIAFSFPISDDANFFAHYDILTQRPTSNSFVSPLQYLYWDLAGRTPAENGNLKPSRTVDYEVGFQQKLSSSSGLKISAYYKELRDMIQRTTLSKVATIGTYDTYGNLDFGTVKGFNFTYDLRRTNNFEFTAAYTLQFADGTGSDPNTQRGLTGKGINIRNIFPFTYDERHRFSFLADYRYGEGKKYNGPRIAGIDIFSNAGVNLQLITASGRPFSPGASITRFDGQGYLGSINGARLPWNYNMDIRVDKNIVLKRYENRNPLSVNVYFRVQNLLNTKNIIGVYRGSKDARDDGYLATPRGQVDINTTRTVYGQDNVQYFIDQYNWRLLDPDKFSLPRRMFVGAIFEF